MKKVLLAIMLFTGIGSVSALGLKIESLTWMDISKSYSISNVDFNATNGGSFNIARQYITIQGDLSDMVKARMTLDIVNGLNMLKYAYVDWKIMPELVVTLGLQKTFFGNLPSWEYPLPIKDVTEIDSDLTATASADLGIAFGGNIAKMLDYHIQFLNGEGYKTWNVINNSLWAVIADVNVTPIEKMLKVGLSVRYADKESKKFSSDLGGLTMTIASFGAAAYADFKLDALNVNLQFISINNRMYADTNNFNGNVISAFVSYDIFKELSVMVRFDMMDPYIHTDMTNDNYSALYAGLGIKPVKGLTLKPMVALMFGQKYNSNMNKANLTLKLEAEYKFGAEIIKEEKKPEAPKPIEAEVAPEVK